MKADIRDELMNRLDHFSLAPKVVVDIDGEADGSRGALIQRFPRARLIATGSSSGRPAERESIIRRWFGRGPRIEHLDCPIHQIPLTDGSVDLVIAHDWSPGVDSLDVALEEIHRVLATGGLFLCSSPSAMSVPGQPDIHDFGSALMRAGFIEPVLDIDRFSDDGGEIIHVAAFAGPARRPTNDGEVVVPFPKSTRR
jgi:malonyl-CoA O-methyltransferase